MYLKGGTLLTCLVAVILLTDLNPIVCVSIRSETFVSIRNKNGGNLPSFKWARSASRVNNSTALTSKLVVIFPDGGDDDYAMLIPAPTRPTKEKYDTIVTKEEECAIDVWEGELQNEKPTVSIAVNGCPGSDTFDVI